VHAGTIRRIEILLRIGLKAIQTTLAAEIVGLPLVLGAAGGPGRLDTHPADDIRFHPVYL
jgi:hypothetical protein